SITSALNHFRAHGQFESRPFTLAVKRTPNEGSVTDIFDGVAYLEMYPDVADAIRSETQTSAFEHFLNYGRKDGRTIPTRFDGGVRKGTALDLLRLDAARITKANTEALRTELGAKSYLQENRISSIESTVSRLALASDVDDTRSAMGTLTAAVNRVE